MICMNVNAGLDFFYCLKSNKSETKDVLKPICNGDCVILGRSKAKNQNNPIVLTVRPQSFGTRLKTESRAWRLEGEH